MLNVSEGVDCARDKDSTRSTRSKSTAYRYSELQPAQGIPPSRCQSGPVCSIVTRVQKASTGVINPIVAESDGAGSSTRSPSPPRRPDRAQVPLKMHPPSTPRRTEPLGDCEHCRTGGEFAYGQAPVKAQTKRTQGPPTGQGHGLKLTVIGVPPGSTWPNISIQQEVVYVPEGATLAVPEAVSRCVSQQARRQLMLRDVPHPAVKVVSDKRPNCCTWLSWTRVSR